MMARRIPFNFLFQCTCDRVSDASGKYTESTGETASDDGLATTWALGESVGFSPDQWGRYSDELRFGWNGDYVGWTDGPTWVAKAIITAMKMPKSRIRHIRTKERAMSMILMTRIFTPIMMIEGTTSPIVFDATVILGRFLDLWSTVG